MAKVKLGSKEFHLDSEEIDASGCGVSDADCVAFVRFVAFATGEISRVKTLNLVSFIVLFCWNANFFCFFSSACVRANMSFAEQQPSRQRGSEGDCHRSATEQQRAGAGPCKMNSVVDFHLLNLGLLLLHRFA